MAKLRRLKDVGINGLGVAACIQIKSAEAASGAVTSNVQMMCAV